MALTLCGETASYLDRYKGNVAINVKYHGSFKLSTEMLAKLAKLDGAARETILRYAEEGLRESWWASAQERARELGLGDLWSDGRSGGWLVFRTSVLTLELLIEEAEKSCVNCREAFSAHTDKKCPFEATAFSPGSTVLGLWHNFRVFSEEMTESLNHAGDTFEEEVLFQLENFDDDAAGLFPTGGGGDANPAAFQEGEEEDGDANEGIGIR